MNTASVKDLLKQLEDVLAAEASKVVPEGSTTAAVVHQWAHALAYGTDLFSSATMSAKKLRTILSKNGLYTDQASFRKKLRKGISQNLKSLYSPQFTFIDLFAGIGGIRLGLQQNGGVCVFSSEWDKSAQKTYFDNYGDFPFGDITKLTSLEVTDAEIDSMFPEHDVLAGGFPCQPFSHAGVSARNATGKEHGFKCKTQGTLFFDVMRIASIKKPKVLFLENVRNIERHDKGYTFQTIRESIEELGYDFKYSVIDASSVVPQKRVRCYMVCFRKDLDTDFKFPEFIGEEIALKDILETDVDEKYTISQRLWDGHINRTKRNVERGTGFTAFLADINKPAKTLVARYGKDGKECLIPQEGKTPRMLTPTECRALQGYPVEFTPPVAKTPAYKQFGNSVVVPVISRIAKEIVKEMK
jgi:DNA (cytosine-5)-methyltransferase 1